MAVGGAQISVNGGNGTWQTEKTLLLFFTFYNFLLVKNMIWAKKLFWREILSIYSIHDESNIIFGICVKSVFRFRFWKYGLKFSLILLILGWSTGVKRNWNMQKSTKAAVLKVADTHYEQLLFYNFPKFGVRMAALRTQRSKKWPKNLKKSELWRFFQKLKSKNRIFVLICRVK
jgi:hypothetical protein